ncbi:hypothetical protein GEMRC1_007271 [Eukaryota sp. GEM-RC1]
MDEPLSLLIPQFFCELPISSFPLSSTLVDRCPNHELTQFVQILEETTEQLLCLSANFLSLAVNLSTNASPCNHLVLNIGFNDEVAQKFAQVTDPLFVYQCYRLFIETYSSVVFGVSPQDLSDIAEEIGLAGSEKLDVTKLKMLINGYQNLLQFLNHVIPQDPREQLSLYVQKVSEKLPTDPIQLKVQCLLINDIHQPAITIDPSTKAFVTCEHGFDQNDTLLQSNHCTTSDGQKLDRITKDLNAKAESIEDVVLFIKAEPEVEYRSSPFAQLKKKFKGKRDTGIAAAATCLILVILGALVCSDVFNTDNDLYSNAGGLFELEPLNNGIYELTFELAGYDTEYLNVTVSDSDESLVLSLDLTLVSLELYIYDEFTSQSVPNSRVQLNQDSIVDGNEEGYVLLADLIPGDYELTLMHSDYYDRTLTVQLDSSKTESFSLRQHPFTLSGNTISSYDVNLIIPASINDAEVNEIGEYAISDQSITAVVIPDTVHTIARNAFNSNHYLRSVTLGSGITSIGLSAFTSNGIVELVLPNNVVLIDMYAFMYNALVSVTFGNSIQSISGYAFAHNSIESIVFPHSLQVLRLYAFHLNPVLRVEIGNGVDMVSTSIPGGFNTVYNQYGAGVYSRTGTSGSWSFQG